MKVEIEYLEKPITKQEVEVAAIFELATRAVEQRDLALLRSVFAPDAVVSILTKAGEELLKKDDFMEKMREVFKQFRALSYKEVHIQFKNDFEAAITCVCAVTLRNAIWPSIYHRYFTLQKRNGTWYVVRLTYFS